MASSKARLSALDMAQIALFTALISVCAWISIPTTVPFTLQTFGVLCALGLLGGKRGTLAVLLYLLLGAVGVPVFSGMRGGVGMLLGVTGGFLAGFLACGLVYWLFTRLLGERYWVKVIGLLLGLIVCYALGTVWFTVAYAGPSGPVRLGTAILWCVTPFLVPEAVKFALAALAVRILPAKIRAFGPGRAPAKP